MTTPRVCGWSQYLRDLTSSPSTLVVFVALWRWTSENDTLFNVDQPVYSLYQMLRSLGAAVEFVSLGRFANAIGSFRDILIDAGHATQLGHFTLSTLIVDLLMSRYSQTDWSLPVCTADTDSLRVPPPLPPDADERVIELTGLMSHPVNWRSKLCSMLAHGCRRQSSILACRPSRCRSSREMRRRRY